MANYTDDLRLAHLLADNADSVSMSRFKASDLRIDTKPDMTPVSDADVATEQAIRSTLAKARPRDAVHGEEGDDTGWGPRRWIIDPIDGTKNFVQGSPDHAVMIAEVINGEQSRGWIWQPEHHRSYVTEKGAGVELNGVAMTPVVRDRLPIGATSKNRRHGFDGGGTLAPVERSRWCCGIDYPRLFSGDIDFLTYTAVHPWDHLPGTLMVRELGGVARLFDGTDYHPGFTGPGLLSAVTLEIWDTVMAVWGEPDL